MSQAEAPVKQATEKPKIDHKKIKAGDLLLFMDYAQVTGVTYGGRRINTRSLTTSVGDYAVDGIELIEGRSISADQYTHEEALPKTKLTAKLQEAGHLPFTCVFIKKDGTERTLRGRWLSNEASNQGYTSVEDLEVADPKDRFRQIDNRTIKSLIIGGVKYTLK